MRPQNSIHCMQRPDKHIENRQTREPIVPDHWFAMPTGEARKGLVPVCRKKSKGPQHFRGHQYCASNGTPAFQHTRQHLFERSEFVKCRISSTETTRHGVDMLRYVAVNRSRKRHYLFPRSPDSSTIPPMLLVMLPEPPSLEVGKPPPRPPRVVRCSKSILGSAPNEGALDQLVSTHYPRICLPNGCV